MKDLINHIEIKKTFNLELTEDELMMIKDLLFNNLSIMANKNEIDLDIIIISKLNARCKRLIEG